VFSLSFVLVLAGLAFGGLMALIGFGGFLTAWFHHSLGTPLPLPTLHNKHEKHLYLGVAAAGFVLWGITLLISLRLAP
jgi:TRAP-type C4-dicarboxylate transport system permease small subunit